MTENLFTLKGTLYAKETRRVQNKKKPDEPDWEFMSIKVETQVHGRTATQIPELHLDKGLNFDMFSVGDQIEVDFYLTGKKISDTWFKTEARASYIKFSDIVSPPKLKQTTEKIHVSSMSNPDTIGDPPKKDNVFLGAKPQRPQDDDDDDSKDLPF